MQTKYQLCTRSLNNLKSKDLKILKGDREIRVRAHEKVISTS
jgi:hypothetical protein